jgi:serine/threonine-protein kinase
LALSNAAGESNMANQKVCPRCGTGIDWSIPAQLCPRCLLQEGLDAGLRPRVIGDYELIEEVARGGMGVVYKARQKSLGRIVAVKLILSGSYASEETIRRFRTEAETAAKLQHPNIVAIHDVGEHEGQPYFSMDYVEGENLEALARHRPMEPRCAASYVRSIASAIHYAHRQGILHRDLKPTNILVDTFDQPRITDFGLARTLETESTQTVSGQVLGSPNFMPPEQAAGEHRLVSVRSDVYSLGAILYYLLTGRLLFPAGNIPAVLDQVKHAEPVSPRLLSPEVSRDLETICLKCLEKAPGRRYESALALAEDLGCFLPRRIVRYLR